ncbi:hypothetical protein NKH18_09560 [Streptomyces sp. M10(2022)]
MLLGLLILILIWETIRANMAPDVRAGWPWRLQLLDIEALGSLLAVAAGAVLARAQYARTVRPTWAGRGLGEGDLSEDASAWRVGIFNGGQHIAAIEAWDCMVVLAGESDALRWVDATEASARLTAAGYAVAEDFQMMVFGRGFRWWALQAMSRCWSVPSRRDLCEASGRSMYEYE